MSKANEAINKERDAIERLNDACCKWSALLLEMPGWVDFQTEKMRFTLGHDLNLEEDRKRRIFDFDEETTKKHDLIMSWFELYQAYQKICDCEYYFRRYPFNGLPVDRYNYLINNCEMFFSRIAAFRNRLGKTCDFLAKVSENKHINKKHLIDRFNRDFKVELDERTETYHHISFDDVELQRVRIFYLLSSRDPKMKKMAEYDYKRTCKVWVKRVRSRKDAVEKYLRATADGIFECADFIKSVPQHIPNQYILDRLREVA